MSEATRLWIGIVFLSLYLIVVLFAGNAYVRLANRRWLEAHEAAMRGRLLATDDGAEAAAIDFLLGPAPGPEKPRRRELFTLTNWVGSCEIARWVRLHEAQRLEIVRLTDEQLTARFARAMGQIDELPTVRRIAWQRKWMELSDSAARDGWQADGKMRAKWEAELSQLLAELFNARDSTYNQLVSLYGKASWLVVASYLAVVVLFLTGFGSVLLAGFLGGLISRLQRIVYAKGRPTAYGASWVPLFVAPLLGALVAWAGLHLIALLQNFGVANLQNVIPIGADFRSNLTAGMLGLAVLFGFSERFFNQIGAHAESVVAGDQAEESVAAAGIPASPLTRSESGTSASAAGGPSGATLDIVVVGASSNGQASANGKASTNRAASTIGKASTNGRVSTHGKTSTNGKGQRRQP